MKGKIYVIEDDQIFRESLAGALGEFLLDYSIQKFKDALLAYDRLVSDKNVEFAIVDQNLPKMLGTDFIQKCSENYPNIKCISMSGEEPGIVKSGSNVEKLALDSGAIGFLKKPFRVSNLVEMIKKHSNQ